MAEEKSLVSSALPQKGSLLPSGEVLRATGKPACCSSCASTACSTGALSAVTVCTRAAVHVDAGAQFAPAAGTHRDIPPWP
jgi:hypothetical protein